MFSRLGRTVVRRRRLILALTGVFVVVAAVAGVNVFERLGRRGFDDPGSESYRARQILEDELRAGDPDVVLLVDAGEAGVDDPAVVSAGEALTEELASEDAVASAVSYWSLGGASPLRDDAGREAIVLVDLTGTEREVADAATALIEDRTGRDGPLTIGVGGREAVAAAITDQVQVDLAKAEAIAVPATLVLLVVVFGGLLAAALPMAVALVALIGTFLALFLVALVTDVSVFSINLTTALGLGLSIDYSLFIVNRFREELRAGRVDGGRARPHDGDRGADRGVLCAHGRGVAGGAARVPALLPAVVRLRRDGRGRAGGGRVAAHAAGAARRGGTADRRGADRAAPARVPGARGWLLAPPRHDRDAPAGAGGDGGRRPAARARRAVPASWTGACRATSRCRSRRRSARRPTA